MKADLNCPKSKRLPFLFTKGAWTCVPGEPICPGLDQYVFSTSYQDSVSKDTLGFEILKHYAKYKEGIKAAGMGSEKDGAGYALEILREKIVKTTQDITHNRFFAKDPDRIYYVKNTGESAEDFFDTYTPSSPCSSSDVEEESDVSDDGSLSDAFD